VPRRNPVSELYQFLGGLGVVGAVFGFGVYYGRTKELLRRLP
jgi:hypothetical protein